MSQSDYEYLWNLADKGILVPHLIEGRYEFSIKPKYSKFKDLFVFAFQDRINKLHDFAITKALQETL